jgi:predicted porin/outer membrane murein-binding lipoprotein Lpp
MGGSSRRLRLCSGVAFSALILVGGANGSAKAEATDAQIKELQAQVEMLARTVKELKEAQTHTAADAQAAKKQAIQADANAAQAKATAADAHAKSTKVPVKTGWAGLDSQGHYFLERKPGKDLTFFTPGGEITAYGNLDVSIDATTKNAGSLDLGGNTPPVGNFGWMPAISTNLSYLGVRGFQRIPTQSFNFVYQFEAGIDISAAPGDKQSNSNLSNQVNGALFSRNSFIGLSSPTYGAIKVGKSDGPYKNSTAAFNPFSGMIGDYAVIMGNSGGDNRVEFGTRISHAIWYESPKFGGGFQFNVMFAPGQNRADDSSNLAAGESDCAGGNDPTSGGNPLVSCSDGAFSNAVSTNLSYTNGPFYITGAYEWHQNVNRSSDIAAIYGVSNVLPILGTVNCATLPGLSALGQQLCNDDVANEDAMKLGIMYTFPTKTTVGVIGERLHRYVPADLDFQNERTRYGSWLVVSQELSPMDSLHFGWAHAFRSPGNPGQHNDGTLKTGDSNTFSISNPPVSAAAAAVYGPNQNQADMLTAAYKHKYSDNLTWYTTVAATFNGPDAHYDLGAGGHLTTDCHDATGASGGITANAHCFTGTTLVGVSTGLQWKF